MDTKTNIMHGTLPRIITQDPRHHDDFFTLCEPSFLATKIAFDSMALRLSGRRREVEPGQNTEQGGEATFNCKEISPPLPMQSRVTTQVQNPVGKEGRYDVRCNIRSPEPGKAGRQLFVFVEVAQVEDYLIHVSISGSGSVTIDGTYVRDKSSVIEGILVLFLLGGFLDRNCAYPSRSPSKKRVIKNVLRPVMRHWQIATMLDRDESKHLKRGANFAIPPQHHLNPEVSY